MFLKKYLSIFLAGLVLLLVSLSYASRTSEYSQFPISIHSEIMIVGLSEEIQYGAGIGNARLGGGNFQVANVGEELEIEILEAGIVEDDSLMPATHFFVYDANTLFEMEPLLRIGADSETEIHVSFPPVLVRPAKHTYEVFIRYRFEGNEGLVSAEMGFQRRHFK